MEKEGWAPRRKARGRERFFRKVSLLKASCSTPIRLKAATRTGRGAGRGARRGGLPGLFKPDDIAFKQGKVARKLFAPGIGEGRHARQFVLDGPLAAAHERQAALVAISGPAIQRVSAHSTHRPRYMIRRVLRYGSETSGSPSVAPFLMGSMMVPAGSSRASWSSRNAALGFWRSLTSRMAE